MDLIYSSELTDLLRSTFENAVFDPFRGSDFGDSADAVSTNAYGNGSSGAGQGPDLIETGLSLALEAYRYNPAAKVYYGEIDGHQWYFYGTNEADAVRRLEELVEAYAAA